MCETERRNLERNRTEIQAGELAEQNQNTDYYVQDQLHEIRERSSVLSGVRKAVEEHMPQAYHGIDAFRSKTEEPERRTTLHNARGKRLTAEGARVLEFDVGGSGFKQFRSDHLGISGAKSSVKDYMWISPEWYNKFLGWISGIKNLDTLRKEAKDKAKFQSESKEGMELTQDEYHNIQVIRRLGKPVELGEEGHKVKHKHIRMATMDDGRQRVTMAGPLNWGGLSNSGEYSIDHLKEYMREIGTDYLKNILASWEDREREGNLEKHDIWIRIRGHSRGGVAAVQGAMMIKKWVNDNYPGYKDWVKFELTQFDPVPGWGSRSGLNEKVSITEGLADEEMMELGDSAETTVVYSLHSNYIAGFTPQEVTGAKRVIITPYAHSVSLDEVDTQKAQQGSRKTDVQGENKAHRAAFTNAEDGETYRLSSLNELPEGVYILDEINTLVCLKDKEKAYNIIDELLKDTKTQEERHKIVKNVVEEWFSRHG